MSRLFSHNFRSYKQRFEGKIDYKKKVFIAFEGAKTEPTYFTKISKYINSQEKFFVEIFPVKRNRGDGKSHPKHIRDGIIEYYNDIKRDFIKSKDRLCILFDIDLHFGPIDKRESKYNNFLKSLTTQDGVYIYPYVTNPCFELWLILQLETADNLDLEKVRKNNKIEKSTYLKIKYNELNKKKSQVAFIDRLQMARINSTSPLLETNVNKLWLKVGTNINSFFEYIFDE